VYFALAGDKVIIGAQFDPAANTWFWSDGSVAPFNSNGLQNCTQKAWYYNHTWQLIDMECSGKQAFYACQVTG